MIYQNLSPLEKRQFKKFPICPLCFREIQPGEDFEQIKIKVHRSNVHTFMHRSCILNIHKHTADYIELEKKLAIVNNRFELFKEGGNYGQSESV